MITFEDIYKLAIKAFVLITLTFGKKPEFERSDELM